MTEKTISRKIPKSCLRLLAGRWRYDCQLFHQGSRSSWNGAPSGTAWLQANGRIGEGLTECEEIQSPRNPITPRRCSLILLLVHPTVYRSILARSLNSLILVTLKYRECHWPLRKQANSFRQNKSIKDACSQCGDSITPKSGEEKLCTQR